MLYIITIQLPTTPSDRIIKSIEFVPSPSRARTGFEGGTFLVDRKVDKSLQWEIHYSPTGRLIYEIKCIKKMMESRAKLTYQYFGTGSSQTSITKFYKMQKCSESTHTNKQHGKSHSSFKDEKDTQQGTLRSLKGDLGILTVEYLPGHLNVILDWGVKKLPRKKGTKTFTNSFSGDLDSVFQ